MREESFPIDIMDGNAFEEWSNSGTVAILDYNDSYEVLKEIDNLLKEFGLEIVIWKTELTDYWFSVVKKNDN